MGDKKEKILLVDALNLLFRAYYAFIRNPLINSRGENTSAVYGFTNMLFKLIEEEEPDYLAVVFDSKEGSFRDEIYEEYKSNREEPPEDLKWSIPEVKKLCELLAIQTVEEDGLEADDTIAVFTRRAQNEDLSVRIASSDKDLYELVNDDTFLITTRKGISDTITIDEEYVREKMGVEPGQVWDYLTLTGDSSDNIPGVKGIGDKSARKLLSQYRSVEEILDNLEEGVPERMANLIKKDMDNLKISRQLVELKENQDVDREISELKRGKMDEERLRDFLQELEFYSLIDKFLGKDEVEYEVQRVKRIEDEGEIEDFLEDIQTITIIFDGSSILMSDGEVVTVIPHGLFRAFFKLLRERDYTVVGHNFKDLYKEMIERGEEPFILDYDVMLAEYLLKPEDAGYSFEEITFRQLGINLESEDGISDMFSDRKSKVMNCVILKDIYDKQLQELKDAELLSILKDIEMPLIPVLAKMESVGVAVDRDKLKKLSDITASMLEEVEMTIFSEVGERFNINSPKQLSHILFDVLDLPPQRKTKTGYSTDEEVLKTLSEYHPLPAMVIEYRHLSKLKSTYIDPLPTYISPETGRIHTSFVQTGTATGRLSSRKPNLQNIPIRTELGAEVREAFISSEGTHLASFDYSQIELRIFASLSKDDNLIEAFDEGKDIHTATAREIFNDSSVTPELRRRAKAVNFGLIYGKTPYGLSQELNISVEEAEEYIDRYFERYPRVREFMDELIERAKSDGYAETMFGRRRYLPELESDNANIRRSAERMAINMPIQGTAADILKIAMIDLDRLILDEGWDVEMVLTIHDEILFEVDEDTIEKVIPDIKKVMESAVELKVPIVVDYGYGSNWRSAH